MATAAERRSWESIALPARTLDRVRSAAAVLAADVAIPPPRLLLIGPSGCGKTLLAEVLAAEAGATLVTASASDLRSDGAGETAKRVEALFERARAASPSILFLDGLESSATARPRADAVANELVTQLLLELYKLNTGAARVLLLAATNAVNDVDASVVSKFSPLEIRLPDAVARARILRLELTRAGGCNADDAARWSAGAAPRLDGFSGRDLAELAATARDRVRASGVALTRAAIDLECAQRLRARTVEPRPMGLAALDLPEEFRCCLELVVALLQRMRESDGAYGAPHILFVGPPGCGKTALIEAVAEEVGWPRIPIDGIDLKSNRSGERAKAVHAAFDTAAAAAPTVLTLDDIDWIARDRTTPQHDAPFEEIGTALDAALRTLRNSGAAVAVLAGTLAPENVDRAVLSHFLRIDVPPLDRSTREALAARVLTEFSSRADAAPIAAYAAAHLAGATPRDVRYTLQTALRHAVEAASPDAPAVPSAAALQNGLERALRERHRPVAASTTTPAHAADASPGALDALLAELQRASAHAADTA